MFTSTLAFVALITEGLIGYPKWISSRVEHPKVYISRLVILLEQRWKFDRKKTAIAFVATLFLISIVAGNLIELALSHLSLPGYILLVLIATTGFSQLALDRSAERVYKEVKRNNLEGARTEFSKVTGESASTLSFTEIIDGSIARLAWGFSAASVAPAFWLLVGELPGLFAYMTISMAAMSVEGKDFGLLVSRIAFIMNFVPEKVAGFLRRAVCKFKKKEFDATPKGFKEAIRISHRAHMLLWVIVFIAVFL